MRPSFMRAILGGLLATIAITFLMYFVAPLLLGEPMDIAKVLGNFLGTTRGIGMAAGGILAVLLSLVGHIVYGAILGAVTGGPESKAIEERRAA